MGRRARQPHLGGGRLAGPCALLRGRRSKPSKPKSRFFGARGEFDPSQRNNWKEKASRREESFKVTGCERAPSTALSALSVRTPLRSFRTLQVPLNKALSSASCPHDASCQEAYVIHPRASEPRFGISSTATSLCADPWCDLQSLSPCRRSARQCGWAAPSLPSPRILVNTVARTATTSSCYGTESRNGMPPSASRVGWTLISRKRVASR